MSLLRLVTAAFLLTAAPVNAAKLDKPICDDLKVEQGLLQQKGVPADLARGPEWGKANLSRPRLKEIERLIQVEEQLAFRCPQPKKPLTPGEDEDGTVVAAPAKGAKAGAKTAALPKAAKPAAKATAADEPESAPKKKTVVPKTQAPQPASAPGSAAPAEPARKPAPVPKAKPKTEDAYSPPAGAPSSSPFKN